jgi:hypothetical protein
MKTEAEIIFMNIMLIMERLGDKWINLSWEQYKQERQKDGNFHETECQYFEEVHPYTLSADLAQEVKDGVEGRKNKYKHQLKTIYFFRLKGYYIGYLLKDLDKMPLLLEYLEREYICPKRGYKFDADYYELIELPLLPFDPLWSNNKTKLEQFLNIGGDGDYFIEASKFLYDVPIHIALYEIISLFTLVDVQEKDFVSVQFLSPRYYYYEQKKQRLTP